MQQRKQKIILKGFQFKVDELVIEQETNELGMSVPDTALKAIAQVVSAPQQLLGIEGNGRVIDQSSGIPTGSMANTNGATTKPRRRRRTGTRNGEGTPGSDNGSHADSVRTLILALKNDNYFTKERSAVDVTSKLHQQGHTTAKAPNVRMALVALAKSKDLHRSQDAHKKYVYRDSPYQHD